MSKLYPGAYIGEVSNADFEAWELGHAWQDLAAAMPMGWFIRGLSLRFDGWRASVGEPVETLDDTTNVHWLVHDGPSAPGPAEALQRLAEKLRGHAATS